MPDKAAIGETIKEDGMEAKKTRKTRKDYTVGNFEKVWITAWNDQKRTWKVKNCISGETDE